MDSNRWMCLIVGVVSLVVGRSAIVKRKIALGDGPDGPDMWLYGWRAVLAGAAAVTVSAVMFACAAGFTTVG
ncbi:hypothetical protein [Aquincola tertiaricarbonis]|uniref:hypothetical protein n=1 Tax=Aquincola tertiaricarbonis TaxID=391953 RepID=UPI000614FB44|nr:hypothetical protein [Aquincola tertiaricarbonis]